MKFDRATLIGCGGTGGALAPHLARLCHYHAKLKPGLLLVDGDSFEEHNVQRQCCGPAHIGKGKAEVVSDLCAEQGLVTRWKKEYVSTSWMMEHLSKGRNHLIIAAVDNDATRRLILDCLDPALRNFLFISPGNADDADGNKPIRGGVLWWAAIDGVSYGMNPATLYPNLERPEDHAPVAGSCSEHAPSSPQLLAANAMAAACTLAVLQDFLDDRINRQHHALFFNTRSDDFRFALI